MIEKVQIFSNQDFGEIRTILHNNEPWFVGKDVAMALGYSNPRKAVIDHVDEDDKTDGVTIRDSIGRKQNPVVINESGLYSLILASKLPSAKKFKHWVTAEVLPGIRKHGGYIAGQEELSPEELMAKALIVAQKTLEDRDKRIKQLVAENQSMAPKAEYFDALVKRNLLTNFRDTAKELNIPQNIFIAWLLDKKYLYRDSHKRLMPYAAKNKGLFELKECVSGDWAGVQTLVTPKGRDTFRVLCVSLQNCG